MIFDAEAYAEGICEHAAGSTIEVFVDTIDATVSFLHGIEAQDEEELEVIEQLIGRWNDLRTDIVQREEDNEEGTVFTSLDDEDDD